MARRVDDELRYADNEARRYVRHLIHECDRLGHKKVAAFAVQIARGTVSLAPTPDDPQLEWVGSYIWAQKEIRIKVMLSAYDERYTQDQRAHRLGMTKQRFGNIKRDALLGLTYYLRGKEEGLLT